MAAGARPWRRIPLALLRSHELPDLDTPRRIGLLRNRGERRTRYPQIRSVGQDAFVPGYHHDISIVVLGATTLWNIFDPCAVCPQSRNGGRKSEISTIAELIWYNQFNGYICCQKGGTASMNGATTIQERLKDLRLNKGLKLEELAEQTGISKSALGSYEKDDYKEINHGNLILLADFYGVSLDYLFCRTENRAGKANCIFP